jgi:hypothetical protein
MPRKNTGQGSRMGMGGGGAGRGRGGGARMGGGGFCLCPKCGHREAHEAGMPCIEARCPSCGSAMVREGSPHHREIELRRARQNTEP